MTHIISAIIIEDEPESQNYLYSLIKQNYNQIHIIAICDSVKDALITLQEKKPDLVFLDIELKDGNAFDLLDQISNYFFEIIFITGHTSYLEKSIDYYGFNYLTKPIDTSKLMRTINRFILKRDFFFNEYKYKLYKEFTEESKILLNLGKEQVMVFLEDIIKCEADGNYCRFYLSEKLSYHASLSLGYYEELLKNKGFFRVNRSTLINLDHIKSIQHNKVIILSSKEKVEISVRKKKDFLTLIENFA